MNPQQWKQVVDILGQWRKNHIESMVGKGQVVFTKFSSRDHISKSQNVFFITNGLDFVSMDGTLAKLTISISA